MQHILPASLFLGMLCLERKRAERSRKTFLLVLIDAEEALRTERKQEVLDGIVRAANEARRDTDPAGWYKDASVLGIIFTEFGTPNDVVSVARLLDKIDESLARSLRPEDHERIHVSLHLFGDDNERGIRGIDGTDGIDIDPTFYPDILHLHQSKKIAQTFKRIIDIAGSMTALLVLSPLFAFISIMVKLTSKGPILFRQQRLGRFGVSFQCLKFRTMYANNDFNIHRDFITSVIKGTHQEGLGSVATPIFKMTNDPRVTRIGRFLRRSSLDELPQFINILIGDMSLVGPRPPIAYEFKEYDLWHRRRVLEVKPGLTGLWQVNGRSRVRFDEMVRLDLRYARRWNVWLDLKIIAKTPRAVVFGDDAY